MTANGSGPLEPQGAAGFEDVVDPQLDVPAGVAPRRRIAWPLPPRLRLPAAVAVVATVVVAALVATTMPWQPRSTVGPTTGNASASPSGSGSAEPSAPIHRPAVLAYEPVAELTPGSATGSIVALDSDFRLASQDGTPAAELASRLTVEPALEFIVEPEATAAAVRLRPNEPLTPGAVYRFTLSGPEGNTLDTWAFQARQSVQVVSTLPGDTETDVPLDTGIEITFDQDGVVDAASHVTIQPATSGRFELHGRVLAFAPDRLRPATVYTVTVSRGVEVAGTGETMADDVRFQFETAATAGTPSRVTFQFPADVIEAATAARPELAMWAFTEDDHAPPATARIEVYRLPDLDAAIGAYRTLQGSARWARWSSDDLVPTAGLRRVAAFNARLQRSGESLWFRFPQALPPGSYLVHHPSPDRPIQTVLQVTDVAGYLAVSDTRMLVWANDLATRGPLARATVGTDGASLGRTDADGLFLADTPASLKGESGVGCEDPCTPVVVVTSGDGRSAFLPAGSSSDGYPVAYHGATDRDEGYWLVFHTDRTLYRRTDTVNVWGVVRDRNTGAVPETVDVRLVAGDAATSPSIAALHLRPGPTGAFTGSVRLNELPEGYYELALRVGSKVIGSTAVSVDRILKPAYRLDVTTGRRVYLEGDRIAITAGAAFFEGTPVPGVPLRLDGTVVRSLTTDSTGVARYRTIAHADEDSPEGGDFSYQSITVSPARAEEGEIGAASREFIVFPSSRTIDAQSTIRAGRVRVQGGVHVVDRESLERELAAGRSPWELDPRGAPVAGAIVTARFVEVIPVRTQVGTSYDFIEKRVVPQYEYDERYQPAGTIRIRTGANGAFVVSVPDSGRDHDYRVSLSVGDPDGHPARTTTYASRSGRPFEANEGATLGLTDPSADDSLGYGVGQRIDLTLRDGRPARAADRFLFYVAQRGLRAATVQRSPRYLSTFEAWAPPSMSITGVRFNGTTYVDGGEYGAWFRATDRAIEVSLSTRRPRYAPSEQVDLEVTTRDDAGRPVAATVILQAVDEKLFQLGGAFDTDPLGELYQPVSSGLRTQYASHRVLREGFGEGGDTTGGGGDERTDFRDALLFEAIDTGPDGRASTTFHLSDDLTSWRVGAVAITRDLRAGGGSINVPVGLPLFVDASIAPEYLAGDRPSIQVRAYGSGLAPGAAVRISVTSESLGLAARTVTARAFEDVTLALPPLTPGVHTLSIAAQTGSGPSLLQDRMTRSFVVIESRLERTRTSYLNLSDAGSLQGGDGLTTLVISDASAGRYLPLLLEVAGSDSARLERALAAAKATSLLAHAYGVPDSVVADSEFDGGRYQTPDGGIAPVPYAGSDLQLSALAAIAAADQFDTGQLRGYLDDASADSSATRERRMYALAGLAALGAPVLPQIQAAAADRELTVREQLMIGLGAAALGDARTARSIAVSLLESYAEDLGQTVRLRVGGSTGDITVATSLMAILAAATGEPLAPALWSYVEANPSADEPYELHAVAYVARLLGRVPVQPARFAYTIDGNRTVIELDTGESFQMTLTAAHLAGLSFERLSGEVGVASTWREPVAATAFTPDPDLTLRRSRTPSGPVTAGTLVRVDLTVTFGPQAPAGCHQVSELVPSGLVPVGQQASWYVGEEEPVPADVVLPYAQSGQRVWFCAEPTARQRVVHLRYYARVITPGSYVWEPAVIESRTAPDRAALTGTTRLTIQ